MDQQNPTLAKIPILDPGKFEQWQFRIQQYLQHEHYALWEVIEFGDSYEVPTSTASTTTTDTISDTTGKKKGRTVTLTTEDMQKRKNDKARTTLLLSLPKEHQLQFSKYKTPQKLWAAILKTFGGNEATKKTKKNLLKQQYGTLKRKAQKLWSRHLIDYRGNKDVNTASVSTASTNVPTTSANIGVASISQDTFCAYIASQSSGKKIRIQGTDVAGFDKSKVECFNCHMMGHFGRKCRASRSQDRGRRYNYIQGSKVEEQALKALMAIDKVGWDWSYMENDEENHALVANEEAPTEFALMANIRLEQVESRLVEHKDREIKYCEKIKGLEIKTESGDDYIEILKKELETIKKEKERLDGKLAGFQTASKDLDSLLESQRLDKNKEGLDTANDSPTKSKIEKAEKAKKSPVNSQNNSDHKGYWDSGCSRHMTGNISYLSDFEPFDGGYVSFGQGGCKITGKGTIKTGKLEFKNVYFMKDLKYNLFSVS
nr:ribonuclease H-like domain-containing protein [Tanacetum cinerariifolium]